MNERTPLPDTSELSFEPEQHIYTLHGQILPSVTQIMRPMSMILYDGVPSSTLAHAADRGTRVHEQTEMLDAYDWYEDDAETAGYMDAYRAFLQAYQPKWLAVEWRAWHKALMYAGTLDRIGYIEPPDNSGAVDLVDIKTTRAFHDGMLSTQLGGYSAILQSHGVKVRKLYGLQLLPDGKYTFREVNDNYKTFLACLQVMNIMNAEGRP